MSPKEIPCGKFFWYFSFKKSTDKYDYKSNLHHDLDDVLLAVAEELNPCIGRIAIDGNRGNARLLTVGVLNSDEVCIASELTANADLIPICRDAGIESKSVVVGVESAHILSDCAEHPAGSTRYPSEECLTASGGGGIQRSLSHR